MNTKIFKYQNMEDLTNLDVRTANIDGEIWFVGFDVATALGYAKPRNAISAHCKERGTLKQGVPTTSGIQEMTLINEPNVYRLIIKSKLPSAERFEEWLFEEVLPRLRKTGIYTIDRSAMPNFIVRYNDNWDNTDKGYFSVISELYVRLYGSFEKVGYKIPDRAFDGKEIRPDVSVGQLFAKYLIDFHPELGDSFKRYRHRFPNGITVKARQYKNELLGVFANYVDDIWIPERAEVYFRDRDPLALDYLPKLLDG